MDLILLLAFIIVCCVLFYVIFCVIYIEKVLKNTTEIALDNSDRIDVICAVMGDPDMELGTQGDKYQLIKSQEYWAVINIETMDRLTCWMPPAEAERELEKWRWKERKNHENSI